MLYQDKDHYDDTIYDRVCAIEDKILPQIGAISGDKK